MSQTPEQVADEIVSDLACIASGGFAARIAAAIREAEERGRATYKYCCDALLASKIGWIERKVEPAKLAAPLGHILDDAGKVRKVLGALPVTADGVIVCPNYPVWAVYDKHPGTEIVQVYLDDELWRQHQPRTMAWGAGVCYSTREAALAAATVTNGTKIKGHS